VQALDAAIVTQRQTWAYSEHMPVLPLFSFNLGVSPLLQWTIVPVLGFCIARLTTERYRRTSP